MSLLSRRGFVTGAGAAAMSLLATSSTKSQEPKGGNDGIGKDEVDIAIVTALRFLHSEQAGSGAWKTDQHGESTAATSLAVMAFLASGHVPGEGPYGQRLNRAIRWVVAQQKSNGMLVGKAPSHGPMYSHGIATLMLAEVIGMVDKDMAKATRVALEKAISLILKAQSVRGKSRDHVGGWRYLPSSTDSDLSVSGWQVLALRAAKDAGCDVPAENIDKAVSYIKRLSVQPRNMGFGYQSGHGPTPTRAGTGIVALEVCGEHHSPEAMGAAEYFLQRPLNPQEHYFYYGIYYCTVGMFKIGGDHWRQARPILFRTVLKEQRHDGSWVAQGGSERGAGRVYATAMAVLALAVEYRYLPIYQR